jgi:CRP-like cAMP-binding protein
VSDERAKVSSGEKEAVVRVELKRANAVDLVRADQVLAGCALVSSLGARANEVLARGVVRRCPDKVVIFQKGDAGGGLLLVLSGEVRLIGRKGPDQVELGTARRGEVFGEAEVLSGKPERGCSAVAHGSVDFVDLPREALLLSGTLPQPIARVLEAVSRSRTAQLDEMADFLNRW